MDDKRPGIGLLTVALVWGVLLILSGNAIEQMGRGLFLTSTFMTAYLILSLIYRKSLQIIRFQDVKRGLLLGLFLFGIALCAVSLKGSSRITLFFFPVLLPLLSMVVIKVKPKKREILATLIGVTGLALFGIVPGYVGAIGAVLIALYLILSALYIRDSRPEHLLTAQTALATVCSMVLAGAHMPSAIALSSWGVVLGCGIVGAGWGLSTLTRSLQTVSPIQAGLVLGMTPCILAIWTSPGCPAIEPRIIIGMIFLAAGCLMAILPVSKERCLQNKK